MRKRVSKPLTVELANRIKELARNPDLAQHQIAAKLEINQGRVSEVLTGKRFAETFSDRQANHRLSASCSLA